MNSNLRDIIPQAFRNYDAGDNNQREVSNTILRKINPKDNFELIFALLTDQNEPATTKQAILSWLQYKYLGLDLSQADRLFWHLVENLHKAEVLTIALSIDLFAILHDNRAVPIITEFLSGDFELTAILALSKIGHPDSKEPLYRLMQKYPPGHSRREVLASILAENFKDQRVINELIFNLDREDLYLDVWGVVMALRNIGALRNPIAIPTLLKISLDVYAEIREAAIYALVGLAKFLDKSLTPALLSQLEKEQVLTVKVALLTLIAWQGYYDVTDITIALLDRLQREDYIDLTEPISKTTGEKPLNDPVIIYNAKIGLIALLPDLDKEKALRVLETFLTREKQADKERMLERAVRHSLLCVQSGEYIVAIPKDISWDFVEFMLEKQKMTVDELLEITLPVLVDYYNRLSADNSDVTSTKFLDSRCCEKLVLKCGGKREAAALRAILETRSRNGTLGLLPRIRLTRAVNSLLMKDFV